MRGSAFNVLALISASIALAEPPEISTPKATWEWKAEERLARRFEPLAAEARRAAAVDAGRVPSSDGQNVVVGKDHPELLLTWELMDHLLPAYGDSEAVRREKREKIINRTVALQLGDDFWERLYRAAQTFFDTNAELKRLQRELSTTPVDKRDWIEHEWRRLNDTICPSRAEALAAARQEFGHERFDRFLYQGVAPDAVVIFTSSSGDGRESLLWLDGGCR